MLQGETFAYDNLDRLDSITGPQNLGMDYDAKGNITRKSDIGSVFGYNHPTKPYVLTGLETSSGAVSDILQTVTYTSFEQPSVITEIPYAATFTYNSDGQRAKMAVTQNGSTILTRWYAGSRYSKETAGSTTKEYTWIGGDAYSAPCLAVKQSGTTTYYYLLRDNLGTITHITDASGNVVSEYSFDAWGRRRDKDDWSYTLSGEPAFFADRGFTGHEWLPWFNLYNMNGRLYDPTVGRFLSPDPIIADQTNTQEYNRYSFALNNPLKYTDPSGYKKKAIKEEDYFDFMGYVNSLNARIGGGGYARQNYSNSLNYKFGQMSNSYFWDQLLETTKQLPDGEYKMLAYGLNSKNKYEFLFKNMDEERRQNEFNNRMILASASNIGYGLSFEGDGESSNGGKGNWLNSAWNSAFVRSYTGDAIFINTSFSLVFLGGGSNATGFVLPLHGPNAFELNYINTASFRLGAQGGWEVSAGKMWFNGVTEDAYINAMNGYGNSSDINLGFVLGWGPGFGGFASYDETRSNITWYGGYGSFGFGIGGSFGFDYTYTTPVFGKKR